MRENGIFSTGVFMVRADWTHEQFELLYDYVRSLQIAMPLFTILTPLPGTQLYRAYKDKLLTTDHRLFDLLHAVLPTRLPRDEFYREFARSYDATEESVRNAYSSIMKKRPAFVLKVLPSMVWFYARTWRYQRIHRDYQSFLRDEAGLMNGPGAKAGLTWQDIAYPSGDANELRGAEPADVVIEQRNGGKLVKLRISKRTWADDVADASVMPNATVGE